MERGSAKRIISGMKMRALKIDQVPCALFFWTLQPDYGGLGSSVCVDVPSGRVWQLEFRTAPKPAPTL